MRDSLQGRQSLKCVTQRYGRSGAMCVTSLQGRQSLIYVTLWIGRSSAMTEEKEDPTGLRGLETAAGAAPRSKNRAQLCSLAVRAKPQRQGRPGALTYAMAGGAPRSKGRAHLCRLAVRVEPQRQGRPGALEVCPDVAVERTRSALMLPRSRHIRTALKCVTSLQGRQSLICVTLWIGRSGAMTKEKEDPTGLRGLETAAGAAPRSKGRARLCSLAVRAKPHRQGRPGALTYAMAGAAPKVKGCAQLCSLAVRVEPQRQGRPGTLTYAMAGAAPRSKGRAQLCSLAVRAEPQQKDRPGELSVHY